MTLKDKLNALAAKTAALKQAQADVDAAANALVTASGDGDQVIPDGHCVVLADEQAVITVRDGMIEKLPIFPLT